MRGLKRKLIIFIGVLLVLFTGLILYFNQVVYMLVFQYGYSQVYSGNDSRGNKIMKYTISKMDQPGSKIYHAMSVQNTKNGNYDIAIAALEKAYEIDSETGAYYGWVLLYYYRDYTKALEVLEAYDALTPENGDWPMGECLYYLKGLAYMQLHDYDRAINMFNLSIKNSTLELGEDWVDYQVFLNKGLSLFYKKDYKAGILEFRNAIKNNDECAEAYYYIGLCQIELQYNELACSNLNTANQLIKQGYKSSDPYIELFHEIYEEEVKESVLKYCKN